ncbi:DNA damage-binding protein 1a [Clydaea vesicula]|uniref:DNA damage-binding protein 1a n=1 Tax=Clydaea vesicula TaxID=447962 RepID=A0AAD5Y2Y3_9FUNG|nr:DNA damage-binding protein 1a [Clydaea vesicula]
MLLQSSSVLASVPLIFKGETLLLIGTTSKLTIKKIFNSQSKEITSCEVNARIATIQTIKHDNDNDFIFLTTEKYQVAILALRNKEENQEEDTEYFFETVYTDSIRENIGRPVDCGQLLTKVAEDLFCLHLYQGLLLFIPTNIYKGKVSKSRTPNTKFRQRYINKHPVTLILFNRIEELNVISMASFTSFHNLKSKQQKKLKIALLCVDSKEKKFIKIYSINMELLCIESDAMFDVEADSNFLIPANFESNGDDNNSGFFIVGECQIIYYKRDGEWLTYRFLKSTIYKCFTPINRISLLLGDFDGNLMLLTVKNKKIVMEHLGKTSMANSLAYLDNGIVFLGSHFGDSKLLKLLEDAEDTMQLDSCDNNSEVEKNYILELETYENLSPIVDFVVVDLLKRGQSQMVACCGGYKSASLKVIGQGLGIDELISMDELTFGSLGMWSLRQSFDSDVDDAIVFSFYEETRMIAYISESILGEIKNLGDFDYNKCTVNCGNVNFNLIVQVTSNSVLLLTNKTKGFKKIDEFITENEKEILFASIIFNQVLIGLTGGELIYFKISKSSLKIISRKEMHQDISCLSLGDGVVNGDSNNRNICAVGYWDCTVCLYSLPDFECVDKEHLPNDVISRSIMIKTFDDVDYILVAQGDGNLNFLQITKENNVVKGFVKYMSSTYLGLEPVTLFNLKSVDVKTKKLADGVLVASDRPTIINASNGKFLYSSVNLKVIQILPTKC